MLVTFWKLVERRVSTWTAVRGKRTRIPGATMALGRGDLPHDLIHLIVEAATGLEHGFWGCLTQGATFKGLGRKRTKPGRAIINRHRDELKASETLVFEHYGRWRAGKPTPAGAALARLDAGWRALADGGHMTVVWPTLALQESTSRRARSVA
jgi:hypothetical protein